MPGEGRGLSSRQTQDVVRDLEIGQPSNSEKCSEAADGITRESEGGGRLSLLRPVRQDQPRGYSGACLCPASHGRSTSNRPEDWPPLALRRSAAITRNSPFNSSNGLNGCVASPATVELSPPPGITTSGKPEPTSS